MREPNFEKEQNNNFVNLRGTSAQSQTQATDFSSVFCGCMGAAASSRPFSTLLFLQDGKVFRADLVDVFFREKGHSF
jgi:hypothetical protein